MDTGETKHAIQTTHMDVRWMTVLEVLWRKLPSHRGLIRSIVFNLKSCLPPSFRLTNLDVWNSSGCYSNQSAESMFDLSIPPDHRHWHSTSPSGHWVTLNVPQNVDCLRRIVFKCYASHYTGRFPNIVSLCDANGTEILEPTAVTWPESVYALAPNNWQRTAEEQFCTGSIDILNNIPAGTDLSKLRINIVEIVYPRGRDPPGSRYDYNARKLSLNGIEVWGGY